MSDVPEAVVLEIQRRIYAARDEWLEALDVANSVRAKLEGAERTVAVRRRALEGMAAFLDEHSPHKRGPWLNEVCAPEDPADE